MAKVSSLIVSLAGDELGWCSVMEGRLWMYCKGVLEFFFSGIKFLKRAVIWSGLSFTILQAIK